MTTASLGWTRRDALWAWLRALGGGLLLGAVVVVVQWLGIAPSALRSGSDLAGWLSRAVGPVWVPMAAVALRVLWLAFGALRTRAGQGPVGRPVRGELGQLAPLFAALGLCGTVWGLSRAFDALGGGNFMTQLPLLLSGLGAAMTSTLAGLGLQIGTLLLASVNPAWSSARVTRCGDALSLELDGEVLGRDDDGLAQLADAIAARRPEALRLEFARGVTPAERAHVRAFLWPRCDAEIPLREVAV